MLNGIDVSDRENDEVRIVDDVWVDFMDDFHLNRRPCDQILIITDEMFLRGPNLDSIWSMGNKTHIN